MTAGTRTVLRLEALAEMIAALVAYRALGGAWGTFFALFLVPDLSFAGYLAGPRVGAAAYNALHSLVGPVLLGALGLATGHRFALQLALIWFAHVGFDRALGYGLKAATGFADTHLGRLARLPAVALPAAETKAV